MSADIAIQCVIDAKTAKPTDHSTDRLTDRSTDYSDGAGGDRDDDGDGGGDFDFNGDGGGGGDARGRDLPASKCLRRLRYTLGVLAIMTMAFIALFQAVPKASCMVKTPGSDCDSGYVRLHD